MLVRRKHGKQGLQQARAAVVTLASLLAEAGWIDDYVSAAISRVNIPRAEEGQRAGTGSRPINCALLMNASRQIATSDNQMLRNYVLTTMLCTMALRREELAIGALGGFQRAERPRRAARSWQGAQSRAD